MRGSLEKVTSPSAFTHSVLTKGKLPCWQAMKGDRVGKVLQVLLCGDTDTFTMFPPFATK